MRFLERLFRREEEKPIPQEPKPEKYHCVRFMTERGEQVGMLLTQEEFETAVGRWVQTIKSMPIQESIEDEEGVM